MQSFNSTLVRLDLIAGGSAYAPNGVFQFHFGSIRQ